MTFIGAVKALFKELWSKVDRNTIAHFSCSALIVLLLSVVIPPLAAGLISAGVGLYKEYIWDKKLGRGQFDSWDLFFDWIGVVIGIIIAYVI